MPPNSRVQRTIQQSQEAIQRERARRSAQYFVFESGLVTKDEHDVIHPIKPFYDEPYLRALLDCLLVSGRLQTPEQAQYAQAVGHTLPWLQAVAAAGILAIEKSRQVMATWVCCAYALWRAKSYPHQLILIQSKREEDAANLVYVKEAFVARISFMETHLPAHLRTLQFPKCATYAQLFFPNGSHIWGIPEGGDVIRSNTPSVVIADEAAFQPEFDASYTAALPAIKGGGSYVALSSANPGSFQVLVEGV